MKPQDRQDAETHRAVSGQLAWSQAVDEALQTDQVRGVGAWLAGEPVRGQNRVLALGQDLAVVTAPRRGDDVPDVREVVQFVLPRHHRSEQVRRDVDHLAPAGLDRRVDALVRKVGAENAGAGPAKVGHRPGRALPGRLGVIGDLTLAEHQQRQPRCTPQIGAGPELPLRGQERAVQRDVR